MSPTLLPPSAWRKARKICSSVCPFFATCVSSWCSPTRGPRLPLRTQLIPGSLFGFWVTDRTSGAGRKWHASLCTEGGPDGQIALFFCVLSALALIGCSGVASRKESYNLVGVWFGILGVSCVGSCLREPQEFEHRFTREAMASALSGAIRAPTSALLDPDV